MMLLTIAGRELRSMFLSPLAWTLLALVEVVLAYLFSIRVDLFVQIQPRLTAMAGAPGVTELIVAPLFGTAAFVLLLIVPLITMRLISDEMRNRTLTLLFSAPLSMTEIVLGKYLGVLGFLLLVMAMIALMPLSLLMAGSLDFGMLASGLLGLFLLLAAFAAVGLFMSALTSQPAVAAVAGFAALLLLWIVDWGSTSGEGGGNVLGQLSMLRHYEPLLQGMFRSSDVIYFLLVTATFLVLAIRRLDSYRLQH